LLLHNLANGIRKRGDRSGQYRYAVVFGPRATRIPIRGVDRVVAPREGRPRKRRGGYRETPIQRRNIPRCSAIMARRCPPLLSFRSRRGRLSPTATLTEWPSTNAYRKNASCNLRRSSRRRRSHRFRGRW